MAKRWYSVSVLSNFEKKIAEQIKQAVAEKGLEEEIDEVLVPTEDVVEMRAGQQRLDRRVVGQPHAEAVQFGVGRVQVRVVDHQIGLMRGIRPGLRDVIPRVSVMRQGLAA